MLRMDQTIRQRVFKRDNYTCRYCGSKKGPFHADHVYPWSKGGETSLENLVTACEACNHSKHARVGIWPKPIGYFEKKGHSPYITIVTLFGVVLLVNGAIASNDGFELLGRALFVAGIFVAFCSIGWNLTRS